MRRARSSGLVILVGVAAVLMRRARLRYVFARDELNVIGILNGVEGCCNFEDLTAAVFVCVYICMGTIKYVRPQITTLIAVGCVWSLITPRQRRSLHIDTTTQWYSMLNMTNHPLPPLHRPNILPLRIPQQPPLPPPPPPQPQQQNKAHTITLTQYPSAQKYHNHTHHLIRWSYKKPPKKKSN